LFVYSITNKMSVILRAAEAAQLSLTSLQQKEITDYINQYRKAHQVGDLVWNDNIAQFSKNWSNYLVMNDLFQHSGNSIYGENLAYFQGYGTDVMTLLKLSIDLWYKEIEYYNFEKPGFSAETGHFTCLVWKSSTTFGMGISIVNDKVVVSFNTSPPGNIIGEFEQNVLPRVSSYLYLYHHLCQHQHQHQLHHQHRLQWSHHRKHQNIKSF
jgi:hypothetical protein